uniref:Uncharacterized protein n=1 Tax=Anguilla anguilla TaxID=7936 RepID=A0A0E9VDD3_ANGAN
MFSFAWYQTK